MENGRPLILCESMPVAKGGPWDLIIKVHSRSAKFKEHSRPVAVGGGGGAQKRVKSKHRTLKPFFWLWVNRAFQFDFQSWSWLHPHCQIRESNKSLPEKSTAWNRGGFKGGGGGCEGAAAPPFSCIFEKFLTLSLNVWSQMLPEWRKTASSVSSPPLSGFSGSAPVEWQIF